MRPRFAPRTLSQKLTASGSFAVTATSGSSGVFLGWFNSRNTGNGRRDTLGFRFAGQGSGCRLTLQLVTDKNQACGTKVTPWVVDKTKPRGEGRKFRPTSIRNDGTRYAWTLAYDPDLNDGNGQMEFTIRSAGSQPEPFETKTHIVPLPKGYKDQGTSFDRFGLMNGEKGGNPMTIYFDDLQHDGKSEEFSTDPGWVGSGNHATFSDREQGGAHDFGFSAQTCHAGGAPGEIGGVIWRSGLYGYYADPRGAVDAHQSPGGPGQGRAPGGSPGFRGLSRVVQQRREDECAAASGQFYRDQDRGPDPRRPLLSPCVCHRQPAQARGRSPRGNTPSESVSKRGQGPVLTPQKVFPWTPGL